MARFEKGHKPLGRALKGHLVSEDTKNKIRLRAVGRVSGFKGRKHTKESKLKSSMAKKGKMAWNKGKTNYWLVGNKNPNWKGGSTDINTKIRGSIEYRLWRESVFKRDSYTCIWCNIKSGHGKTVILHADHIKPFCLYPELRFAIDNGRTLCIDCHRKTETFAGRIQNIRREN